MVMWGAQQARACLLLLLLLLLGCLCASHGLKKVGKAEAGRTEEERRHHHRAERKPGLALWEEGELGGFRGSGVETSWRAGH